MLTVLGIACAYLCLGLFFVTPAVLFSKEKPSLKISFLSANLIFGALAWLLLF